MLLTIVDNLPPEVVAMLQAEYSRNHESIRTKLDFDEEGCALVGKDRIEKLKEAISKWYTGYGHNSIGDCGTITLFIESVSILAAKAIQDNNLYNGQECSTRYIPFDKCQRVYPNVRNEEAKNIIDYGVELSIKVQKELAEKFKRDRPQKEGENLGVWERAMNAKAFDVARSLLPAGVCTNLAWTGTIRNIRDNLRRLSKNPLNEIRNIAEKLWEELHKKYPSSFKENATSGFDANQNQWMNDVGQWTTMLDLKVYEKNLLGNEEVPEFWALDNRVVVDFLTSGNDVEIAPFNNNKSLPHYVLSPQIPDNDFELTLRHFLKSRPKGCEVPYSFNILGTIRIISEIDYGSWRDLQRHRSGITLTPRIPSNFKFHDWYMYMFGEHVSKETYTEIEQYIEEARDIAENMSLSSTPAYSYQYVCPLGACVILYQQYGLASAIYMVETRSSSTVHPIARQIALNAGTQISKHYGIPIHMGREHADSIHRGTQTILRNKND